MLISCEKCATKYNVEQSFIGKDGRKVKCTQCNHIWHANIVTVTEEILQSSNTGNLSLSKDLTKKEETILPAKIEAKIPLWIKMSPYPLFILIISIYFIFYSHSIINIIPATANLYKHFDIYNTHGLKLQRISLSKFERGDNVYDILIEGKIVNKSKKPRNLPSLKLSILDKDKKNIISNLSKSDGSHMEPGEDFVISNKITNLDEKAKFISIDIGNKLELMLR